MALSKEYTVYCLSKKNGWINTKNMYDSGRIENVAKRPIDVLLEIQFITEITHYNKPAYKDEKILYQTDSFRDLEASIKKYGKRPQNPYI